MKHLLLVLLACSSGCTTIVIENGNQDAASSQAVERWHHGFALDLYEASQPVRPNEVCSENSWATVKREVTPINFLASLTTNWAAPIWYPKTVTIQCSGDAEDNVNFD